MSEVHEAIVKIVAIAAALLGLWLLQRPAWRNDMSRRNRLLWSLVALGALGYVNFGGFHTDGTPFHIWDQYHYVIGSKYFPELGYDGIYVATLLARREQDPAYELPTRVRDLRTNRVVPGTSIAALMPEVRARFSDERWTQFRADATHYYIRDEIFIDHGYNPTPAHAAIERLFTRHLPFRQMTVALYAALDFLLLAVAGVVVYRVFGLEILAAAALILGLGYCSRYYWIGGAFLRQDWLVALILCAAALARSHMRLAGIALAYAVCCRVFPLFMLLPLVVFAAAQWWHGRQLRDSLQFALRFAGGAVALLLIGSSAGRGPGAWLESAQRLLVHTSAVGPNAIGLRVPFSTSLANLRGDLIDPTTLYEYSRIAADFAATGRSHLVLIVLAAVVLLSLTVVVAWRARDPATAFVAGVAMIYTFTTPSCYYGSFFVLLALVRPIQTAAVFLIASALMFVTAGIVFFLSLHGFIRLNGAAVYLPVSTLLLAVLCYWLVSVLRGDRTTVPASVSL